MKPAYIAVVIIAVVIVIAGALLATGRDNSPAVDTQPTSRPVSTLEPEAEDLTPEVERVNTVVYDGDSFTPETLTVAAGTTVTFTSQSDSPMWPASAVHPTHTVYPGSGITKCGTDEEDQIFDACEILSQGESYSFTFDETGEWGYHNHLSPNDTGTVVVQ